MPVHASDLAEACVEVLKTSQTKKQAYNLTGGEELNYKEMARRIFDALDKPHRIIPIPESIFRFIVKSAALLPRFQHLKPEMASRMNQDLVFDCNKARNDFGYNPRTFLPSREDILLENTIPENKKAP